MAGNPLGTSYFSDPSCIDKSTNATCVSTPVLSPDVKYWTTGTPSSGTLFSNITRNLYVYFRAADVNNIPFQPGSKQNWSGTLFYNPVGGKDLNGEHDSQRDPRRVVEASARAGRRTCGQRGSRRVRWREHHVGHGHRRVRRSRRRRVIYT